MRQCKESVALSNHFYGWKVKNLEIDILGATKVDSDWLIGRASSRIGIVPITYLKDTNTTQILFCGEDFYENIVELKQKEQIWILQEKNSQLQAQVNFQIESFNIESKFSLVVGSDWLIFSCAKWKMKSKTFNRL